MTIAMGLVLMPVLFRNLPKDELGVWLLLGQSWAALGILDLGFGVTLTRRIAFAKGKSGSDPNAQLSSETLGDISTLVSTGRRIYDVLALFAFVTAFGLGMFYLRSLELSSVSLSRMWVAWAILCLSQALGVWATPWTCLLQGVGYIGWDAILASFMNAITILAQIVVALCGGGLVALAMVAAAGALGQRILLFEFAKRKRPELFVKVGSFRPEILRDMAPVALRAWLTSFGLFLVLNTDQFFVAGMQGAKDLPAYRAAYVMLLNINMLAVTLCGPSAIFISHLWQSGDVGQVHAIVVRNLRLGLGVMACGTACVLGLGQPLFDLWLGAGNFAGYALVATFSLLLFLEGQSFIISTSCRATEFEVFAGWAMCAGVLKICFSLVLGRMLGLWGIALGTLLAQLSTTYWYVPLHGLRRLRIGVREYVVAVLAPVLLLFLATAAAVAVAYRAAANWSSAVGVVTGIVISVSMLTAVVWLWILDESQRQRLSGRFNARWANR